MKTKNFSAFFTFLPQKIEKKWKGFLWWQKILSVLVSVSLVVPLFLNWNQIAFSATRDEEFSLVAILVDQDLYQLGDENKAETLTGKIYRYAEDVQNTMERTKSIVLPVPKNSSSEEIFRILEKWHHEGQKRANDVFFLKGVVLVGNIPLPQISLAKGDFESIFPYTDFENPAFLWNEKRKIWVKNSLYSSPKAEIWHGFLPGESTEIAAFLDRNHLLHEKLAKGEMPAEEKIFMADFAEERKSAHPTLFSQYQDRQENFQDDISYLRYNKILLAEAEKSLHSAMNFLTQNGSAAEKKVGEIAKIPSSTDDISSAFPDASTKNSIDSLLPRYAKVQDGFQKTLSDAVAKTGRWNDSNAGIDSFPQYITLLDEYVASEIKKLNDEVEKNMIAVISDSMEKPIAVLPVGNVEVSSSWQDGEKIVETISAENFLNGKKVQELQFPNECSLYRGSFENSPSQVVVFNSLYDPTILQKEGIGVCQSLGGCCFLNSQTPQNCNPDLATRPVFSWAGSAPVKNASQIFWGSSDIFSNTSYLSCQKFNFIHNGKNTNITMGDATGVKYISSLVVHNEPKNGTIGEVLKQQIPGHLPTSVVRYADFQNINQDPVRISFPDFFAFRLPEDAKTAAYSQFLAEKFLQTKEWEQAVGLSSPGFLSPQNPKKYTAVFQFFDDGTVKRSNFNAPSSGILPPKFLEDAVLSRAVVDTELDQYLVSQLPDPKLLGENTEIKKLEVLGIENFSPLISTKTEYKEESNPCPAGEQGIVMPEPLPISDADFYQKFSLRTHYSCGSPSKKWVKEGVTKKMTNPKQFHQKILEKYSPEELDFLLRWKDMSFDEKHDALLPLALSENQKSFPKLVQKPYAYAHLQVEGEKNPTWKGIETTAFEDKNVFENLDEVGKNNDDEEKNENLDEKCGPIDGVPFWEWLPAVMCWLESLKELGLDTTKQCHISDEDLFEFFKDKKDDFEKNLVGTDIVLKPNSDVLLLGKENVLGISVVKNDGKTAKGEMVEVKISLENAKFLDGTSEQMISLFSGEGIFSVVPENEKKQVKISAVAFLEKGEAKKESEFSVVKNAFLEMKEVGMEEKEGIRKYELVVQAKHENGDFVFFNAPIFLSVSDPMRAFLSASSVTANEKFSVAVRSEQSVEVLSTLSNFLSGKMVLDGAAEMSQKIDRVVLPQMPKILDIDSVASSEIVFLNVFGKEFVPEKVEVVLEKDKKDEKNEKSGKDEKNLKKKTTVEWDGKKLWISTAKESGTVNFSILANGKNFPFSIPVAAVFSETEQKNWNANALYASLFGLENYGMTIADHPAKKMLYASENLAVVSTLLTAHEVVLPKAKISKTGKIDIFDEKVSVSVASTSPVRLSVVDEENFRFLGEFAMKMPENGVMRLRAPQLDEQGVFFENGENSGNIKAEIVEDTIVISLSSSNISSNSSANSSFPANFSSSSKIATISKNGNVEFLDNRFSLQFLPEEQTDGVSFLLVSGQNPYGKISFSGMEWMPISSSVGMEFSAGKTAWNVGGELQKIALMPEIRNGFSENATGLGFEGRENFVLQFAAGESVGNATQNAADPFFINFGDPSLALPKMAKNSAGFDETIGKELVRSEKVQIEKVLPLRFDADERSDLAVVKANGEVEIFSQQAKNEWFSRGSALRFSGKENYFLAGNFDAKGNDDFLLSQNDNQLSFFANENGVLHEMILPKNHPLVQENFFSPHAKDVDDDGFVDIVGINANGELSIVYGNASENFFENAKKIGSFIPKGDEKKTQTDISAVFSGMEISLGDHNADGVLDIFLFFQTAEGGSKMVYESKGKGTREYDAKNLPADKKSAEIVDMTDANQNGVPDRFEVDKNENGIADVLEEILSGNAKDSDGDGLPDDWDLSFDLSDPIKNELQKMEKELDRIIDFFGSCTSGGCLSLPINNAFFVPGTFNNISAVLGSLTGSAGNGAAGTQTGNALVDGATGGLASAANSLDSAVNAATKPLQEGLSNVLDKVGLPSGLNPNVVPVFSWGPGIFCTGTKCIRFIPKPHPVPLIPTGFAMTMGRFYLSPTLTGGVGVAVCKGPGGSYLAPSGACFIQAIPSKFLQSVCDKISPSLPDSSEISFGSGSSVFRVEGNSYAPNDTSVAVEYDLGTMNTSIPSAQNRRVNGTGGFFARWANRQIEEFAAMFTLPALTIYFPDISGTFYDKKDAENRMNAVEKKWNGEGFEAKKTITPKNINLEKDSLQSKMNGGINSVYDSLEPADAFLQEAKYRAGSITEFYELLESVPLLQVSRKKVVVQIPSLSRRKMLQMSAEMQNWVDNSEAEINRFGDDATGLWQEWEKTFQEGWDKKELIVLYALLKDDIAKAKKAIDRVKKNIQMLKYYQKLWSYGLSHLDAQIAQYIYSLICYLDALSDLVGTWVMKNKVRYKKWKEFFATVRELIKIFQTLPNIFNNYESYCKTCQAGNFDQGNFVFSFLGNAFPEPPIIKFPRLPDIVLDISQINAAIHLEIPEIEFRPREIQIPSLPPLRLPTFPRDRLKVPEIPELPPFPEFDPFPPFPSIELPKLPDLPPPPKIPDVFGSFGTLLSAAEKLMYVYCLVRKGIFVYPEATTKSVIETLTERPSNPLSIDFLSQQFPNIELPSIKEIRVTAEVNLEKDVSVLTDEAKKMAKKINEQTSDFIDGARMEIPQELEEFLDQSDAIDEEDKKKLDVDNYLNLFLENEMQKLQKPFANPEKLVDASEIRKKLGLPKWQDEVQKPKNPYADLKKNLVSLQNFHENRAEKLLADENFSENFAENIQNPAVFAAETTAETTTAPVSPAVQTEKIVPTPNGQTTPQNSVKATDGLYIATPSATVRLVASADMAQEAQHFFLIDAEKDGDEDVIYFTKNAVYFKENQTQKSTKEVFVGSVEVANFSNELPSFQAPKNLKASHFGDKTTISFLPSSLEKVKGMEVILKNSVLDETRNNATSGKRIFLLEKSVFNDLAKTIPKDVFFVPENDIEILGEKISAGSEQMMIKKISGKSFQLSTKENEFYSLSAGFILKGNQRGNFSQTVLTQPKSADLDAPFSLSSFEKTVFLYRENEISFPEIYDAESEVKIFWDLDNNGSFETEKNSIILPAEREPTTKNFDMQIVDSAGNILNAEAKISFVAPPIFLQKQDLQQEQKAKINIESKYANVPVSFVRERFGVLKKIITPSGGEKGIWQTNSAGEVLISDFNFSKNAVVKDQKAKVLAEFLAANGKLVSKDEAYRVELLPQKISEKLPMRQVLLNGENVIVANAVAHTKNTASVGQISGKFSMQNLPVQKNFGTFLYDEIAEDDVTSGPIPENAPSFAGGVAIFEQTTQKPLALIAPNGNIAFLDDANLSLSLLQNAQNEPFVAQISRSGKILFSVLLLFGEENIFIDQAKTATGTIAQIFSPKKSQFAALDAAVQVKTKNSSPLPFADVPENSKYFESISKLFSENLVSGYADGNFYPEKNISRAEFVQIALGVTECLDCLAPSEAEKNRYFEFSPFPDVKVTDWYHFCVSKAKKLGMIMGYKDGLYKGENFISRAEAVAILLRQAKIPLQNIPQKPMGDVSLDAWYFSAMATGVNLGLVESHFGFTFPNHQLTRGEFAQMAYAFFQIRNCRKTDSDGDSISDYIEIYNGKNEKDPFDGNSGNGGNNSGGNLGNTLLDTKDRDFLPLPFVPKNSGNSGNTDENGDPKIPSDPENPNNPQTPENPTDDPNDPKKNPNPESEDDLCPFVPEDKDGVDDLDGCPEEDNFSEKPKENPEKDPKDDEEKRTKEVLLLFKGDLKICGFLDYLADIRAGDIFQSVILKDDESEKFSESEKVRE